MTAPHAPDVPDQRTLESFLADLEPWRAAPRVEVEAREDVAFGTHPKEIVTCRFPDGRRVRLLCKYGVSLEPHRAHGHRGGVPVEQWVYERVLGPMRIPSPRRFRPAGSGGDSRPWLVLEYLEGSRPVDLPGDPVLMAEAARIVARLHARAGVSALPARRPPELPTYGREYYRGWASRAVRFLRSPPGRGTDVAWIAALEERSDAWIDPLLAPAPVLIHGEYYPRNVLEWKGGVVVVDWESAAFAAGEIDLAAFTEGWSAREAGPWEEAYRRERWPEGLPDGHEETLRAARIYLQLRWLGDRREWTVAHRGGDRLATLRSLADEAGLPVGLGGWEG